jgi:hypothetical protein
VIPSYPSDLADLRTVKSRGLRHAFDPREFGLSGKGETNEQPAFQVMLDALPDRSAIAWPTPDFKIGLYAGVELRDKTGVSILSPVWHWDDYGDEYGPNASGRSGVQLLWGGSAGERVFSVINCGQCRLGGFSIHGMNAGMGLVVDQTSDRKRVSTSNEFTRIRSVGGVGNRDWIAFAVSPESRSNVEYMRFDQCQGSGNADIDPTQELFGASMTKGSDVLEWSGTFGNPATLIGRRVRVPGAGDGKRFNGRLLDGRILERVDDHHVRLNVIAAATTTNRRWLFDEALGIAWYGGPSYNSMGHVLRHFHALACNIGIKLDGCSVHTEDYNASNNDENWRIGEKVPDCITETRTNSENSRIHATVACLPPFTSYAPSLRLNRVCPGTGFLKPLPGTYGLKIQDGTLTGTPGDGSTVWDFTEAAGVSVKSRENLYDYAYTEENFGLTNLPNLCTFDSDDYQPGGKIFGRLRTWGTR